MSEFKSTKPNYAIADGDFEFPPMQTAGKHNLITAVLSGIANNDTTLELQLSLDGVNYSQVPGSQVAIIAGLPHHTWNVAGLPQGTFIRVVVRKGSAAAGIITDIKMLSND